MPPFLWSPKAAGRVRPELAHLAFTFRLTTRILSRSTAGSISSLVSEVGSRILTGVVSCVAPGMAVCCCLYRFTRLEDDTGVCMMLLRCVGLRRGANFTMSSKFWGERGLWFGDAVVGQNFFSALYCLAVVTWGVGKADTPPEVGLNFFVQRLLVF